MTKRILSARDWSVAFVKDPPYSRCRFKIVGEDPMIDALFIWRCGEEEIRRVENNAREHRVEIIRPAQAFYSGESAVAYAPYSTAVTFVRTEQRRAQPGKPTESWPIFISQGGEEPWMALVLKHKRLKRELAELERKMQREGLL
jgi:hypothetical protein